MQQEDSAFAPMGERLRARRKELGLTLKDVAEQAGFSVGFISQIERGITVPSLSSLISVCRALALEAGSFLQAPSVVEPITRHTARPIYALGARDGGGVTYERLSASFPGNILRTTLIHEPPGFRSESMSHEGEEIFFIVSGALTLEIDGVATVLEAGDSAHFPSSLKHMTWNHTDAPTTVLHTCTMDVFGDGEPSPEGTPSLVITRMTKPIAARPSDRQDQE